MTSLLSRCRAPENLRRAVITAIVVGPILTAINQTSVVGRLLSGHPISALSALRIALTFAVPFIVSLTSSAFADSRRSS